MLKIVLSISIISNIGLIYSNNKYRQFVKNVDSLVNIKKRIEIHLENIDGYENKIKGFNFNWLNSLKLKDYDHIEAIKNGKIKYNRYLEKYGLARDFMYSVEEHNKYESEDNKIKPIDIPFEIISNACILDIISMYENRFTSNDLEHMKYYKYLKNMKPIYPNYKHLFEQDCSFIRSRI